MIRVMNPRSESVISALLAGIVLGCAIAAGGCARAAKPEAPPVLPAARIDYTRPMSGRQVTVAGPLAEVEKRANALMLHGWKAVPHNVIISGDSNVWGLMVLEYRPGLAK